MQATVFRYDAATATGSVITDQGLVLPFGAGAMATSGLRHLRPGQRLTITLDDASDGSSADGSSAGAPSAGAPSAGAERAVVTLSLGSIVPT